MKNGVYQIRNLVNAKLYIGSCSDKRGLNYRWNRHKWQLKNKRHHSIKLQNAWDKYKSDAFLFEIVLYCDPECCLMYEQIALDYFKPAYNICKNAGNTLGLKMSRCTRMRMSRASKGHKKSQQHSLAISIGKKGTGCREQNSMWNKVGDQHPRSKLTTKQKDEILLLLRLGEQKTKIARQFGVNRRTIYNISTGKTWRKT